MAASVLAACVGSGAALVPPPAGFEVISAPPRSESPLVGLARDGSEPEKTTVTVYGVSSQAGPALTGVAGQPAITLTLGVYGSPGQARAAYNGWFASYGFFAAIERTPVAAGEQAEAFDLGWPPLHAVIARNDNVFVLVEAAGWLDPELRRATLAELARSVLEAGP